MFKKAIAKAAAGTAAAALAFVPGAVTAAPQFVNVACEYQAPKQTYTSVQLRRVAAEYGYQNVATVVVTSLAGRPQGQVRLNIETAGSQTHSLSYGKATFTLPRTLAAQNSYTVTATFTGAGACQWTGSKDFTHYIIYRSPVDVRPSVVDGKQAKFRAAFTGKHGLHPTGGTARFTVARKDRQSWDNVRSGTSAVRSGQAAIDFANLPDGDYRLTVRYEGNNDFSAATDTVGFRVRGR